MIMIQNNTLACLRVSPDLSSNLTIYLSFRLSVYQYQSLSVFTSLPLRSHFVLILSVGPSSCLSVCLSVYLSVFLSFLHACLSVSFCWYFPDMSACLGVCMNIVSMTAYPWGPQLDRDLTHRWRASRISYSIKKKTRPWIQHINDPPRLWQGRCTSPNWNK